MSITYVTGDLLTTDVQIKVHQTNCYGAMGAGIARQIRDKHPTVYRVYRELCTNTDPDRLFGTIQIVPTGNGDYICNLFGQKGYGRSYQQTNYVKFEAALKELRQYMLDYHITSVGFPKYIGCGLAGGNWNVILPLIQKYFSMSETIQCVIVEYKA